MEKWNLYNRKGELLDGFVYRGDPIPDGAFHLACEVFIRHADGSFLAMIRSKKKNDYAGKYEFSAGGAAQFGESALDCIMRECREETGLTPSHFEPIAFTRDLTHKILVQSYTAVVDCPKDAVTLQEGETDGYLWLTPEEFSEVLTTDKIIDRQFLRLNSFFRKMGFVK